MLHEFGRVLETKFTTADGCVCLKDAMIVLDGVVPLRPMREVLRIVEGVEGEVELEVEIDVRPQYASSRARLRRHGSSGWAIRLLRTR